MCEEKSGCGCGGAKESKGSFHGLFGRYPGIEQKHHEFADLLSKSGPLDARSRRLVKLGMALGQQNADQVRACTRRALEEGLTPEDIRHAALLSLGILGIPAGAGAGKWVEEALACRP